MNTRILEELSFDEIQNFLKKSKRLIIPFGTVEPHGKHLPTGTDTYCALGFASKLAEDINALIAPPLGYGICNSLALYSGSTTFSDEVYEAFIEEMVLSFIDHGFRQIVFMNGHGGQSKQLAKAAKSLHKKRFVQIIVVDWWIGDDKDVQDIFKGPGGHAAVDETAALQAFRPDLVKKDAFRDEDVLVNTPAVRSYPAGGTILIYDTESYAVPDFSQEKADLFVKRVHERISGAVIANLEYVEKNFFNS